MRRLAALFSLLVIIAAGAFLLWPRGQGGGEEKHPGGGPPPAAANHDPRPLTAAEQAAFLPLVCAGAGGPAQGFAHQCASLPGYPSQDYGGAGLGLGISLDTVILGHLTSAGADEAYVTYEGSFEPHATNFGGGILFRRGPQGWRRQGWYPGGQADRCVSLNPTGQAVFLCLTSWEGQGEADSAVTQETLPPGQTRHVLSASDLRGTLDPNANCQTLGAGRAVLLAIENLAPVPGGALAHIVYVSASDAKTACAAHDFPSAPERKAALDLRWNGKSVSVSPELAFAAPAQ
ncbi:hypothetical protein [Acidocella sp.]|uniref:hypothetical protein n=1 Tax=Acidocella sp. TaxID=50710 RepID=UPI002633CA0B|nr:hypothetical protein [Acidocella sp.]